MTVGADANIANGLTSMALQRPDALAALAPAGRDRTGRAKHVHLTFARATASPPACKGSELARGSGRS
jgi:hypothetical protein